MKKFEVEIVGTTARTYFITAESAEKAEEIAWDEMEADWEIPSAWKQNSELSFIEEIKDNSRLDKSTQKA
tara:strand:+ start:101 stop:310 length:210 start_codon:yes stop_codon:yes gene_type:complete